jgi:hypothetical protein
MIHGKIHFYMQPDLLKATILFLRVARLDAAVAYAVVAGR